MSNYFYAQLDSNNNVTGISALNEEETYDHLISINTYDLTLIGKQYDSVNKVFNTPVQTLNEAQQSKIGQLQQSYYASFTTFQSSALGEVKTYPIDNEAQDNFERLERRLIADPNKNDFNFKTIEDGTLVLHTRAQFLQLLQDAEIYTVQQTKKYDGYVSQVNAATTTDQVNAITWS